MSQYNKLTENTNKGIKNQTDFTRPTFNRVVE